MKINPHPDYQDIIDEFHECIETLRGIVVKEIPLCRDPAGTTVEQCVCAFKWVYQSYIARALDLAESYVSLYNDGKMLPAIVVGRAMTETVVHLHELVTRIEKLLNHKEYCHIYHLIASFALGGKGSPVPKGMRLKKLDIQDSFRNADKTYKITYDEYGNLCEISHPTSMGTTISFSKFDKENGLVRFSSSMRSDKPAIASFMGAALIFGIVGDVVDILHKVEERLRKEWKPDIAVCDLFEKDEEAA